MKENETDSRPEGLAELVDIRDVKIDRNLPIEERVRSYVEQVKDPYCFRVGNVKVHVSYAQREETLNDSISAMISAM